MTERGIGVLLLLAVVLLIPVFSGCVEEEVRDPNVNLAVQQAAISGENCARSDTIQYRMDAGERCHEVVVVVNNQNQQEDLDTSGFYWTGVGQQGAVFDATEKQGPDAIAAGGQGTVTLLFTIPEREVLQTVRYEYVWMDQPVSASIPAYGEDSSPERASVRASGFDNNDNGATDWLRLTLIQGENAPYGESEVSYQLTDPSGTSHEDQGPQSGASDDVVCTSTQAAGGSCDGTDFHQTGQENTWNVGETLFAPCQEADEHDAIISIKGTTILDTTVRCDTAA